jgi:hypothetical protein
MYAAVQSTLNPEGKIGYLHGNDGLDGLANGGHHDYLPRLGSGRAPCRRARIEFNQERIHTMLYTIAVVLIILWLLGMVTAVTMGGLIHVLLVIAIVVILLRVISGRAPL